MAFFKLLEHHLFASTSLFLAAALVLSAVDRRWSRAIWLRWLLFSLSLLIHARYLGWRLGTFNHDGPAAFAASVTLFAAEAYGLASLLLFYLQAFWPLRSACAPARPDSELPTVDVFVTIYDESPEILDRTLSAASGLDYPADKLRLYVLDDGPRAVIEELARAHGASYITRSDNAHAKAGNINHALPLTFGELIMMLDCDHVPVRSFLRETVGHFQDPKVAIVQTPHNFYNPDSFQRNLLLERRLSNEQDLFYGVLLPGRNRFNSVFFCGTSGILRRAALQEAGGFQVWSVIEDLYTSMELHSRGWKSVYVDKILTGALAPESFHAYLAQHQRWTRGGVQVFVKDNPLLKPGLSLMQRLHYTGSLLYFFHGAMRLVYLAAPLPFLYFDTAPISASTAQLLSYFLPYYITNQAAFIFMTRRFRNPFWSDVYETADGFAMARTAVATLLRPDKLFFAVTPKGRGAAQETRWTDILPHAGMLTLLAGGIVAAVIRISAGVTALSGGMALSLVWTVYNMMLLGSSVAVGRERPRIRHEYRLRRRLFVEAELPEGRARGWSRDASEDGLSVFLKTRGPLPEEIPLKLRCACGMIARVKGRVVRSQPWDGGTEAALALDLHGPGQRRQMTRLVFACASAWRRLHHPRRPAAESLEALLEGFWRAFSRQGPIWEREKAS